MVLIRKSLFALQLLRKQFLLFPIFVTAFIKDRALRTRAISESSLLHYYFNQYSQVGQDGILQEIIKRLGISQGTFVEFGAWDGMHLTNCRRLVENGWKGAFIEGDQERFRDLVRNYPNPEIVKICQYVGWENIPNSYPALGSLLLDHLSLEFIDNLDLLVVDVDGADLEIVLNGSVKPKILLIEGGSMFAPTINSPFPNYLNNIQHPLKYIVNCLSDFGYQALCFHQDLYLVRKDLVSDAFGDTSKLSAEFLFVESFNFLPRSERRWQIRKRLLSQDIQDFEKAELGFFEANPLKAVLLNQ